MRAESARRDEAGFTLIEMIVVIAIVALIAGLVLMRQPWTSAGFEREATQRALADALRLAHSRAITQGRNVAVLTGAAGFSVDGGPVRPLPAHQTLSASHIVFMPDGGSSGGTIMLASGQKRIVVTVNWLTGRVRAGDVNGP
ncbi:MAG: type II secretion system protein [Acetobacteraceae bacterium]|nr:type II secretion system protein [Alphaproteobacteria bacterium]MBV8576661.1 type II secretion system protein [Acetobacteraceae bacterium]